MRIRSHLALMVVAVMVPVLIAASAAVENVRQSRRQAALDSLNETVRSTSLIIDGEIQSSLSALGALGNSVNLQTGDMRAFYEQARAIDKPPNVWTALFDESGVQLLNTSIPFDSPERTSTAAKPRIDRALETRKPVISSLVFSQVSGKLLTTTYVAARANTPKRYVVAQGFGVDHWKQTAFRSQGREGWVVAVIDANGKFIARSQRAEELLGKNARPELVAAAASKEAGILRHHTLENVDVYDAFVHSPLTGWTIAVAAPVDAIESSVWESVKWLLVGVAASLCAATLLAAYFGRGLVQAIHGASIAARALGRGKTPPHGHTSVHELRVLSEDLVNAGSLLAHERESRRAAEAERERLLSNEVSAKLAAQAQSKAKDNFLAMLGHELRSPLAAISSAAQVLQMQGANDATRARFLDVIRRQDRHLLQIVDDLLDASRLLAGKLQLSKRPMDLATCVERCVSDLRMTSRASGYQLTTHAADSVWIDGDEVRIEQIVINLVTNAFKYSEPGSAIRVEVERVEDNAILRVSDNGSGMGTELLAQIFEPFVQGPALPDRVPSGLGIGLALVRQLAELHGGAVRAESQGPGHGSVMTVSLPRIEHSQPAPGKALLGAVFAAKLLLVEDNHDARISMAEFLRAFGYEVTEAADGAEALRACDDWVPDAIITDIGLPDQTGYALAARFKAMDKTRNVPLLALTGYGQERDKEQAAAAGFSAHMVKPVDVEALIATLDLLLSASRAPAT